jgi:hypothetical protein
MVSLLENYNLKDIKYQHKKYKKYTQYEKTYKNGSKP